MELVGTPPAETPLAIPAATPLVPLIASPWSDDPPA